MTVIFLAGVHGVGKGYLGAQVAQRLDVAHLTASQLIREEKGRESWGRDKIVTDIEDNQRALVQAVDRMRASGRTLLLDGHFVLRGANGEHVRLGLDVFGDLRLAGVVLLCEAPDTIAARLLQRDGIRADLAGIEALALEEEAHAREVCLSLGVSLEVLSAPTESALTEAVRGLLS